MAILFLAAVLLSYFTAPLTAVVSNEDCLTCHSDKSLEAETERGKQLNLFVPGDALKGSVHEDLSCTDCHKAENESAFEETPHWSEAKPLKMNCGECHYDVMEGFLKNDIHGQAYTKGNPRAPYCGGCHGGHAILPIKSPDSRMAKIHQSDTCGNCHGQEKLNLEDNITKRNLITRYKESVHFQAVSAGKNGASCTDCHSHHNILTSASKNSSVERSNIIRVCQKCHSEEVLRYENGPHGRSLAHGNNDVPNCTTCHGDHDMASLRVRSGDAKQWASTQVCVWCHNNERMMARYGLDTLPVQSYMRDFHGLTQRGTKGASATCSDCHDPHYSLPASHPASRMHLTNRGTACGKCHGQVTENFAQSFSHRKAMQNQGGNIENIVKDIYIVIIVVSVLGMVGYNSIVWLWAVRRKFRLQRDQKHVNRMSRFERVSHFILFITFSALVITGFALKFPEAFWAKWLFSIGMTEAVRASIHRLSATLMTLNLILFVVYMFARKRGRGLLKEILPGKRDFSDFLKSLKFYFKRPDINEHPRYGVFNFVEKFEFWALIWGTGVMVVTGVTLWFPKAIPAGWPTWIINVARVIHYYEALLATLAILIWHGYHTLFHPDEYPMNTSWITGYVTAEEAEHRFEKQAIDKMQMAEKLAKQKKIEQEQGEEE